MNLIGRTVSTTLLSLSAAVAFAAPQQFATTIQNINAGIVVLYSSSGGNGNPGTTAPFAFYNLDNAVGTKPVSWNINNPHPPSVVTQTIVNKWQTILGTTSSDLPILATPISKRNAEYWQVNLDTISDANLSDYNVLLLNPTGYTSLTAFERARLTKFVDQGGILWIDPGQQASNPGALIDNTNSFPVAFTTTLVGAGNVFANQFNPLFTTPYTLTSQDINLINGTSAFSTSSIYGIASAVQSGAVDSYNQVDPSGISQYLGLSFNNGQQTISVAHIGDGEIVVTTQGLSQILNRSSQTATYSSGLTPVNNSYTAASPNLETDGTSAAKFVVNMISQLQSYPGAGGGARKTGGSSIDVTAPVVSRWHQEPAAVKAPPVVYKGVTVASVGGNLVVYSSIPGSDLDHDGNPDDGSLDYSLGQPYDIIWTGVNSSGGAMTAPLSSPVCAEVPDGYKGVTDVVMVVDATGTLYVYNLFPKNSSNQLIAGNQIPLYTVSISGVDSAGYAYDTATTGATPNAPTVSGDLAFIADATAMPVGGSNTALGRIWVVDLSAGALLTDGIPTQSNNSPTTWRVGGGGMSQGFGLPGFTASPTIANIPIPDGSGGYDKVVYAPGITSGATGNPNGFLSPCVDSIWFGVKDESPTTVTVTGGVMTINTRLSGLSSTSASGSPSIFVPPGGATAAQLALAPRLTFINPQGYAVDPSTVLTSAPAFNAGGNPGVISASIGGTFDPATWQVRVDYTIDWGQEPDNYSASEERGRLMFPIDQGDKANGAATARRVLGPIAITPAATLVMTVATPGGVDNECSLWWLKENNGRGQFSVTGRWALYPRHTIPATQGSSNSSVFDDNDALSGFITSQLGASGSSANLTGWHWIGAPVVQGGQVFATASAFEGTYIPVTVLMAFAADPPTPSFPASQYPLGFGLTQPDFDLNNGGSSATTPIIQSTILGSNLVYDSTSGTLSLPNLATINNNMIQACLSLSQPFEVTNAPALGPQEPETFGGVWSPLHWYCVFPGTFGAGRPLVTGNTVFQAANSVVPAVLSAPPGTQNFGQYSAVIEAMDATISPNDANLAPSVWHSWEPQVAQITTSNGFKSDPHIRMPSSIGVGSFSDYITRVLQQVLGTSTAAGGVVGGGSTLAAYGNAGIYGLSRADFVVCDQGRVVRCDSSANITYDSNAGLNTGPGGGSTVGNVTSLVKPSRAYPISTNELLVADAGANRVVKTNSSGVEERSLDHFILDPNLDGQYTPSGYVSTEPKTLNAPQDAITYSNYVYKTAGQLVSQQGAVEYWVHYLVADTGNRRLVELIDRFNVDPNTGQIGALVSLNEPNPNVTPTLNGTTPQPLANVNVPQAGVLLWHSPATVVGKPFDYNSVTRIFLFNKSGTGRYVYVCGVGNTLPTHSGLGLANQQDVVPGTTQPLTQSTSGNGGIVIFDPAAPNSMQVYNNFDSPDLTQTPFFNGITNFSGTSGTPSFVTGTAANTGPANNQPLGKLKAVTAKSIINPSSGNGAIAIMITTANGVYEFAVDPTVVDNTGDLGTPDWFINQAAYSAMRGISSAPILASNPLEFRPTYARRLESGDVIIVNGYNGQLTQAFANNQTYGGTGFTGEVLTLNGLIDTGTGSNNGEFGLGKANLGFTIRSITFNFPTVGRGLVSPVFADRR